MVIEGAEFRALTDMRRTGIRPTVLCVEFDQPAHLTSMVRELVALRRYGYRLLTRDGSNFTLINESDA